MKKVLVIGATGQIGSALVPALRNRYGGDAIVAAGHRSEPPPELLAGGPYARLDVCDLRALDDTVSVYGIETIYHLAAQLSATAENDPLKAWNVNMNGLLNVLEVARKHGSRVFFPSSIGAFGTAAPRDNTPQDTIQRPRTMYGITKVSGELLCDYYFQKYGVDTRGLRYPGLISHEAPPGGGTTDYAVEMFYAAFRGRPYTCYIREDTRLDMMYMPDAVRAAIELMEADLSALKHRNAFNVTAMSIAPEDIARAIGEQVPGFHVEYVVDETRQAIADSWPRHMDDRAAREEWGWRERFDLGAMTEDMMKKLVSRPHREPS